MISVCCVRLHDASSHFDRRRWWWVLVFINKENYLRWYSADAEANIQSELNFQWNSLKIVRTQCFVSFGKRMASFVLCVCVRTKRQIHPKMFIWKEETTFVDNNNILDDVHDHFTQKYIYKCSFGHRMVNLKQLNFLFLALDASVEETINTSTRVWFII